MQADVHGNNVVAHTLGITPAAIRSLAAPLEEYLLKLFAGAGELNSDTPLLAVMNLWFWGLTLIWVTTRASFVQMLYPVAAYYLAVFVWVIGNLSVVYLSVVTVRTMRRPEFLLAALLSPLYWVLMSIAALRAFLQLVTDPSHWEKTTHGLADPAAVPAAATAPDQRASRG